MHGEEQHQDSHGWRPQHARLSASLVTVQVVGLYVARILGPGPDCRDDRPEVGSQRSLLDDQASSCQAHDRAIGRRGREMSVPQG